MIRLTFVTICFEDTNYLVSIVGTDGSVSFFDVKSTTLTDIFSVTMFVRVLRQHAKLLASRIRPFTTTASTLSSSVSLNPDISYVHGVPDTSTGYSSLTLGQVLERQAELNPNKVAFIVDHQQITKTYSKFNSDVMNCFALTRKLNVLICIS